MVQKKRGNKGWQNQADSELNSSEWFGAIIRYTWNLGRYKFDKFYNHNELMKGAIVGNVFKIFLLIGFFYILYIIS